jgi:hypothetical protein
LNVKQIRKRKTKKMLPQVKQVKDTNHCFLLGYKASSLLGQKGCTSAFPILYYFSLALALPQYFIKMVDLGT